MEYNKKNFQPGKKVLKASRIETSNGNNHEKLKLCDYPGAVPVHGHTDATTRARNHIYGYDPSLTETHT